MRIAVELRAPAGQRGEQIVFRTELDVDGHEEAFRHGAEFQAACFALCSGVEHAQAIRTPIPDPTPPAWNGGDATVGLDRI